MKRLCLKKGNNAKRGVASLYIVIFATILFGVITLSFMRIILSEAGQSSDDDLSRSAYDSAMAGVEDAKTAVNRYYKCLGGSGPAGDCTSMAYDTLFNGDCENGIGVAQYLYGHSDGEVKIQQSAVGSAANNNADQAYTCVTVSDEVPDYRGTLTSDTRTKVIPLAVYDGVKSSNGDLSNVAKIEFSWFSNLNEGDMSFKQSSDATTLGQKGDETRPPTISLSLIRIRSGVRVSDLHTAGNNGEYMFSTLLLLPSEAGSSNTELSYSRLRDAGNVNDRNNHKPVPVYCSTQNAFACTFSISQLKGQFSSTDTVILVASLPYADTVSDFVATMYKESGEPIVLKGVQINVDSTGRTNDLVKRVETRLDPADLFFPYPQYALEVNGGGDGSDVIKSFWSTANCWYSKPQDGDPAPQECDNHKPIK